MQQEPQGRNRAGLTPRTDQPTSEGLAWTQRVGPLTVIPGLLGDMGVDAADVLARVGLEPHALDHIEDRIPFLSAAGLLHHCVQATGCPHFCVQAGQRASVSHFGPLGELMLNSPTVGDAMRIMAVHQRLHSEVGAVFLQSDESTAALGYTLYRDNVPHQPLIYDMTMTVACAFLRELCGPRFVPSEVTFSRDAPPDLTPYRRHFHAPLRFNHEYSAVRFPGRWLEQAIPGADSERYRTLSQALAARDSSELVTDLRRALRLLLIAGRSSGDDVAQALSLQRRTLNRRLQAQGTTFQQVLDEVRFEVARHLLGQTRARVADIAAALCYSDVTAFAHAFRRWSGTTPAKWRESAGSRSDA
jgi:AraC-like DNA-binding protein